MATIDEEIARLKFLSGRGRGHEKCHVVLIEEEARKRKENDGPRPKTQFRLDTDDPGLYSRFNELKDRWFSVANKSVALSVMARLWDQDESWIRNICNPKDSSDEAGR